MLLAGCGTDARWLLVEDSRLTLRADRAVTAGEVLGNGLERPVYYAEDAKLKACRFLYEAVAELTEKAPTFGEQFVSDFLAFVAVIVPIEPVEQCSDSLKLYESSIIQLERKLVLAGIHLSQLPADLDRFMRGMKERRGGPKRGWMRRLTNWPVAAEEKRRTQT